MSHRRGRRAQRRFQSRHTAARAIASGARGHRHQVALAPQPWGSIELPVTFSTAAYERQSRWFGERTGVTSSFGGPIIGWCRCGATDRRVGRSRGAAPYWQIEISDDEATAMRTAEAAAEIEMFERGARCTYALGPDADFLAQLNCHEPHDSPAELARLAACRTAHADDWNTILVCHDPHAA